MAPWTRYLFFPEQQETKSAPMWDRPSTGKLISLDPNPTLSPMWNRPSTAFPIFEEAVRSPTQMWSRDPTGAPVCPCCVAIQPITAPEARPRPSTSSSQWRGLRSKASSKSLKNMPSTLGLRIKRSFAQLRKRPSVSSL